MSFSVVYDACVLYPASLRDLFIRLAQRGIVRARWSDRILDETFESILKKQPELSVEKLERTRGLMSEAIRDVLVTEFEALIDGLELPDPKDRHVLAAAIRCGAQAIITFNLKDFPEEEISKYDMEALHPDDFLLHTIDLHPLGVASVLQQQSSALNNPPMTFEELLDRLQQVGLTRSISKIRSMDIDNLAEMQLRWAP